MTAPQRIVVTGASGNVGSGVLGALARHVSDAEVVDVCRRPARRRAVCAGAGRPIGIDAEFVRRFVVALGGLHAIAVTPGWYDVATNTPLMDTTELRTETGWAPTRSSTDSARELIDGLADDAVGSSPALGYDDGTTMTKRTVVDALHDASLTLWLALAAARALGVGRAGWPEAAVIGTNLAAGTPAALDRLMQRRRDPVALLAPPAVGAAVLATRRGGWAPVIATTLLAVFALAERRRGR